MPELPEVETIARQLHRSLWNRTILDVKVLDRKLRFERTRLIGSRVKRVFRAGKFLVIECRRPATNTLYLVVHLRMTGRLLWSGSKGASRGPSFVHDVPDADRYTRATFRMSGGQLDFCDVRRFGTVQLFDSVADIPVKGVDPFSSDFTPALLEQQMAGRKQPMKQWLLRQDCICGIGNIYASEILFRARIHPSRAAGRLKEAERYAVYVQIRRVLEQAIAKAGTSFSDFMDSEGEQGDFERFLRVYGREGRSCRRCKTPVSRIVQAGRSTFFCRRCQR